MFTLVKRSLGDVPAFEWHTPAQAVGETALGKALSVAKEAALCGATQRPYGIGMGKPRQDGRIPVCQVLPDMEWETRSAAAVTAAQIGQTVTLNAAADGVTATTTGGVFTITHADGTDVVRGRFL